MWRNPSKDQSGEGQAPAQMHKEQVREGPSPASRVELSQMRLCSVGLGAGRVGHRSKSHSPKGQLT
jgi:hypothetical protein